MAKKETKMDNLEDILATEVNSIIKNYKKLDIEELGKAKIATEITISFLKAHKDLHVAEDFGGDLED